MQDAGESVSQESVLLSVENPWPGLVSFSETNQAFFCGRDRETADLARRVMQEPLTVLIGKSGLGKSSLLKAGLAPVLRKNEFVPIYIRLDHSEEAVTLSDQIKAQIVETLDAEKIDAPRPQHAKSLWEYFHAKGCDWWDHDNHLVKPVLICDQFEELLTIGQDTPARALRTREFLTELEDLIDNRVPSGLQERLEVERGLAKDYEFDHVAYQVVLALREDFLADLESLHERLRPIMRNRFRLLPMTGEQAMDVILKPGGHLVEENVAVKIVDFVSSSERSGLRGSRTRDEIAERQVEPALLSVVLRELNNRRCHSGLSRITADLVGEGQAAEILQDFYERSLHDMDERVRDFIVDYLLTSSGARNRIAEEDALARPAITPQVIATLINRRVILRHSSGTVKWLELSHDTLADVVRANRAEYQQRRAVAAATVREAEAHRNLVRSRRLVTIFSSLLLLVGCALVLVVVQHFHLKQQQIQLQKSTSDLEKSKQAIEETGKLLVASHNQLEQQSKDDAEKILDSLWQETATLMPGAGQRVQAELEHLAFAAHLFPSLESKRSLANALGAHVLYSYGFIKEGYDAAQRASQSAERLAASAPASDELNLLRAGANYALGKGELQQGRLDDAEKHLRTALDLLRSTSRSSSITTQRDARRMRELTQLAIGDVQLNRYDHDRAKKEYQLLLASLDRHSETSDDLLIYCEAQAYQQLAVNDVQDLSEGWYERSAANFDKAQQIISKAMDLHLDNLLWRSLFAEVSYRQAYTMMSIGKYSDAFQVLRSARPNAENVYNMDKSNLHSVYVLALADRGLANFYQASGDKENANISLQRTVALANALKDAQPSWVVGRNLYGIVHLDEGEAASGDFSKQAAAYDKSRRAFDSLVIDAPSYRQCLYNAVYLYESLGTLQSTKKAATANDYQNALIDYEHAAALLDRIPLKLRSSATFRSSLAYLRALTGYQAYSRLHRYMDAQHAYKEAIQIYRESIKGSVEWKLYDDMANTYQLLGDSYLEGGDYQHAADAYGSSIASYDEGLKRFVNAPEAVAQLVEKKASRALRLATQWRGKGRIRESYADLRLAVETAMARLQADDLQSGLYEVLKNASTEGKELKKAAVVQSTSATNEADTPSDLTNKIDETINDADTHTLLWPSGAKAGPAGEIFGRILLVKESQSWDTPPLLPGAWQALTSSEQERELKLLAKRPDSAQMIVAGISRMRKLPLTFYPDATLYEAEIRRAGREPGAFDYVRSGSEVLVLNGTGASIQSFNQKQVGDKGVRRTLLRLESPEQAAQYLHFFFAAITGEFGTFRIIDSAADLAMPLTIARLDRKNLVRVVMPFRVRQTADGKWDGEATVRYGNELFYAALHINNLNGEVTMDYDTPVAVRQPILTEHFVKGVRVMSDYDYQELRLKAVVEKQSDSKQWKEATREQRQLVSLVKRNEWMTDADRAKELASDFVDLSWYQLLAKDYSGALASSEEGLKMDPKKIALDTNRAHALLFLGRIKEAEDLYRKHLGEQIGKKTWGEIILADLRTFEENGLANPDFAKVREIVESGK